jgi:hypothetical protein
MLTHSRFYEGLLGKKKAQIEIATTDDRIRAAEGIRPVEDYLPDTREIRNKGGITDIGFGDRVNYADRGNLRGLVCDEHYESRDLDLQRFDKYGKPMEDDLKRLEAGINENIKDTEDIVLEKKYDKSSKFMDHMAKNTEKPVPSLGSYKIDCINDIYQIPDEIFQSANVNYLDFVCLDSIVDKNVQGDQGKINFYDISPFGRESFKQDNNRANYIEDAFKSFNWKDVVTAEQHKIEKRIHD